MSRAARSGDAPPLVPALDHEAVAAELANILSGEAFSRSDRLQRFLRFIVDETLNARYLNEYRIATEVYDRKPSFDPASDSIVRVEAGRLRQRLALYYATERENPPVLIELPQRTYVPIFRFRPTPAVSMPEPIPIPPTKEPASRWRGPGRTIAIAAVMIISAVIFLLSSWSPFRSFFGRPVPTVAASTPSVAVLPFIDLTQTRDQAYFGDGLAEEIIGSLSTAPGLNVISRTSSFAYRGKTSDIRAIGKELNATAILEGSIRKESGVLRITAQLIDVSNGYHLWSHTYDRSAKDPFAVEDDIAAGIATALRRQLSLSRGSAKPQHAATLENYNLYLEGVHYSHRWSAEGLGKAITLFEKAVRDDPNFAAAWAALAETRCVLGIHAGFPPRETMPQAKADALRALGLDQSVALAHVSLGLVTGLYEWDWASAQKEFERAHELDPADPSIHEAYIMGLLVPTGRLDEALKQANEARSMDPVSSRISSVAALVHYFRREYDDALVLLRKTLELDPNFYSAHLAMASVYEEKHMFAQAVDETKTGRAAWESGIGRSSLAYTYARMGKEAEARALLNELTELSNRRYISATYIAAIHLALGDRNRAMDWLDKAYEQRSSSLALLKVNPRYDSLRSEPRFIALLNKVGFK